MLVTLLCLTLCDPRDFSPPGSLVHGILQARILEWVAIPCSRESAWPSELLIHAKAWLNLKIIMANERRQNQKEKRSVFHKIIFIQKYKKWKLTYSDEELIGICWGKRKWREGGINTRLCGPEAALHTLPPWFHFIFPAAIRGSTSSFTDEKTEA